MDTEIKFVIKPYLKVELALMYHPQLTEHGALAKMRRWINRNPDLKRKMQEAQVGQLAHRYTPKQVSILVEFLGQP